MKPYRLKITMQPFNVDSDGVENDEVDAVLTQEYGFSDEATRILVQKAGVNVLNEALSEFGLEAIGKKKRK